MKRWVGLGVIAEPHQHWQCASAAGRNLTGLPRSIAILVTSRRLQPAHFFAFSPSWELPFCAGK
jgi:hypothetical protein